MFGSKRSLTFLKLHISFAVGIWASILPGALLFIFFFSADTLDRLWALAFHTGGLGFFGTGFGVLITVALIYLLGRFLVSDLSENYLGQYLIKLPFLSGAFKRGLLLKYTEQGYFTPLLVPKLGLLQIVNPPPELLRRAEQELGWEFRRQLEYFAKLFKSIIRWENLYQVAFYLGPIRIKPSGDNGYSFPYQELHWIVFPPPHIIGSEPYQAPSGLLFALKDVEIKDIFMAVISGGLNNYPEERIEEWEKVAGELKSMPLKVMERLERYGIVKRGTMQINH